MSNKLELRVIHRENVNSDDYTYGYIREITEEQLNEIVSSLTKGVYEIVRMEKENLCLIVSDLYIKTIFEVTSAVRRLGIQNHIWYGRYIRSKEDGDEDITE